MAMSVVLVTAGVMFLGATPGGAQEPTVPVTLTVEGEPGTYEGFVARGVNDPNPLGFTVNAGQSWSGELPLGVFVRLGIVVDDASPPTWRVADFSCVGDQRRLQRATSTGEFFMGGVLPAVNDISSVHCTASIVDGAIPFNIFPTVTCLAGNGRLDVNIYNGLSSATEYRLEVGALSPRVRSVESGDWWRSPVTGRPDGPISVRVFRNGALSLDTTLVVACDGPAPAVTVPEIQLINSCRGGAGFVAWQFANPTNASRSYVIEFEGVPNRSTSAAPLGATVRGVSGRPDGRYDYTIKANGVVVREDSVRVTCNL